MGGGRWEVGGGRREVRGAGWEVRTVREVDKHREADRLDVLEESRRRRDTLAQRGACVIF